jgi:hypothetical protein
MENEQAAQSDNKAASMLNAEGNEPAHIPNDDPFDIPEHVTIALKFADGIYRSEDGKEVDAFIPLRHELILIAKYWATVRLRIYCDWYLDHFEGSEQNQGGMGSRERNLLPFADNRLSWIAKFIGDETVLKAIIKAEEEYAKTVPENSWKAFIEQDKRSPLLHKMFWGIG